MSRALRQALLGYRELAAVGLGATLGLTVQAPLAFLAGHEGINVLLALLVFATATTIELSALTRLGSTWRLLLLSLVVASAVLPALSFGVSRIIGAGPLREGVMAAGLAPCEIASVATTAIAGGDTTFSAGLLIGSTVLAVVLAGPVLRLEAGHAAVHAGPIVVSLLFVVAAPLVAGILLRSQRASTRRQQTFSAVTVTVSVAGLVALIASEVHLSLGYLAVGSALALFLLGGVVLGYLLARATQGPARTSLLLTTSMRDFAIGAGLAAAAFGPAAAAPLGLYGIFVLLWGTGAAGALRRHGRRPRSEPL